ncbi:MAG: diacylglycerol kinase family lipid kinase [Alphaproteobacteria bacterium]|nr:diacylglycerol kinase family lipid kinase [Alphaproteobacteria bacterium]
MTDKPDSPMPWAAAADPIDTLERRQKILMIFNPTAGGARQRLLRNVVSRLEQAGAEVSLRPTTKAGDAETFARDAARNQTDSPDLVVAAGGDGTINEVVNGLAGSALPLAILPMGTANVMAAEIGLGLSAKAVADAILTGPILPIHLGIANGRRFTLMAGIGLDADVVATIDIALKRRTGKLAYAVATAMRWLEYRQRKFRISIDGQPYEAAAAVIANGHFYAGRFVCAADARITDPILHVCLFEKPGRWQALYYMAALFGGFLSRLKTFRVVAGREIRVLADHTGPVQGDGDVIAKLPVDIRVAAETIRLIMPVVRV